MDAAAFSQSSPGKVLKMRTGYVAFSPEVLPPKLELAWELVQQNSRADRALSELAGIARNLPNPHLLIRPFIRREAVLSSKIEGTQASLSDLFYFEAASKSEQPESGDVHEVLNYVRAVEYGLQRCGTFPLSLRLIRELHARLMEGVRGNQLTPGEFRLTQNWIGPRGCTLRDAKYVPPPVPEMHEALDAFEKYLHLPSDLPPLIRLALVHYQFEAIHPFLDGNGRIGRLLMTLLLCAEKVLPQPLLYLSAYFERNQQAYYDHLLAVSQRGEWDQWLHFFLAGVEQQAKDAVQRIDRLLALWKSYRDRVTASRSSALLLRLIDQLFDVPMITVPNAAKLLGVTQRSASQNIQKLMGAGILTETTGRTRNRLYVARGILETVDTSTGNVPQ